MAKALSMDLRERVVAAVAGGMSWHKAAERFGVSALSAIRWTRRSALSRTSGPSSAACLGTFTPQEYANYFAAAGYDAT